MPGKPHSPNSVQQMPYVIQMKNGHVLDMRGDPTFAKDPSAHIPADIFVYKP